MEKMKLSKDNADKAALNGAELHGSKRQEAVWGTPICTMRTVWMPVIIVAP
jgi:hypothetical protein